MFFYLIFTISHVVNSFSLKLISSRMMKQQAPYVYYLKFQVLTPANFIWNSIPFLGIAIAYIMMFIHYFIAGKVFLQKQNMEEGDWLATLLIASLFTGVFLSFVFTILAVAGGIGFLGILGAVMSGK